MNNGDKQHILFLVYCRLYTAIFLICGVKFWLKLNSLMCDVLKVVTVSAVVCLSCDAMWLPAFRKNVPSVSSGLTSTLKIEIVHSFETIVATYRTILRHNREEYYISEQTTCIP
jgi:hypothetical protein